jgi:plasmid stability protein
MPSVSLRDLPPDLLAFLKTDAAAHHRSLNAHLIAILEAYRQQVLAESTTLPK